MREKFFLILSCTGGAGHIRAAEGLHQTAPRCRYPIRTEHYNVLDFTSKAFARLYAGSYLNAVNRIPEVWGYFYQRSDSRSYRKKALIKLFDHFNYKRYLTMLRQRMPDAIICTHFLPFISISNELKKQHDNLNFFAATTDFDVHSLWIDSIVRRYYVFHDETAWQLEAKNVPRAKISVKGIPVSPEFLDVETPTVTRRRLGLRTTFTILILSGGFGIGKVEEIVRETANSLEGFRDRQFNLLVVCGKNSRAVNALTSYSFPQNVRAQVFGFVNNVYELMNASDLLVSKSGGLTSAEAMAKNLPMLIIDPIPGQESRNADVIVEHGAGWRAVNLANLSYKLGQVIEHPSLLAHARKAATLLAKPRAAQDILEDVYETIQFNQTKQDSTL